ncbi:MAG: hypothetical protein ABSB18_01825 [Candidatus Omnitrophota bacterium]
MSDKIKWTIVEKILRIIEVIAVVAAAIIIPLQIHESQNNQEDRSFSMIIRLDEKLKQGANREILYTISKNKPILKENGGKFESYELDCYLDDLDSIEDAFLRKIIDKDATYDWFSDYIIKTFKNKEIAGYLLKIRKEDPQYFLGLEKFAKEMTR